jgi:hypothetical protein
MKWLDFIKNICLMLYVAVVINNIYTMELKYQDFPEKFIREFPLMTLKLANYRYKELDKDDQAKVDRVVIAKKDELFSIVFVLATKLCADNRLLIVDYMCDNSQVLKDILLKKTPIKKLVEVVPWLQKVYRGQAARNFMDFVGRSITDKLKNPQNDFLLNHFFEIEKFDTCFGWHSDGGYHSDSFNQLKRADYIVLKAISRLKFDLEDLLDFDEKNSLAGAIARVGKIRYKYYDTYSLANFILAFNETFYDNEQQSKSDMFYMKMVSTAMISCLLSRLVKLNFCSTIIDPEIVFKNEKHNKLNRIINQSEFAELLSDYLQPIQDPMAYSNSDNGKALLISSLLPFLVLYQQYFEDYMWINTVTIGGLLGSCFCYVLNCLSDVFISDRLLFVGFATSMSLMVIYIIISTIMHMRQLRSKSIPWDEISQLLKKHDDGHIVIDSSCRPI